MAVLELAGAYILDLLLGDPRSLPHPVRWIGAGIHRMETFLRRHTSAGRGAGVVLLAVVVMAAWGVASLLVQGAAAVWTVLGAAVSVYLAFTALATRSLAEEAMAVYRLLEAMDLIGARERLSFIVGRDTKDLAEDEIVRATVETVAENASDGVGAPLFYLAMGGAPLAIAYKAVNTLDSMVGYKDDRYRQLGWASARFDDLANFVPARLTALAVTLAAFLLGDGRAAWRILSRDRNNHPSPNSGHPEAAMAGALGVRLGGTSYYRGVPSVKPYIGDALRPLSSERIKESVRLLYGASFVMLLFALMVVGIIGAMA